MPNLSELHRLDKELDAAVKRAQADPHSHELWREAMAAEKRFNAEASRLRELKKGGSHV